ncbi:hypothetical protein DSM104329_04388 [Capillimicrobium parvum]|uniref:D-glucuronyl C5-epimerase C-terminal domain-containing protein n=1 Tax=Capillimicrobium parvum TaxID=2884022 RepID=A0A9E7C211_9ACTN|nr:hypothetical protein DSM104329_04388 [Capillimicrobium parvum]
MVLRTAVLLALLSLALTATATAAPVHVLSPGGREVVRQDRHLPPPDPRPSALRTGPHAHAAAARKTPRKTTGTELLRLRDEGAIAPELYDAALATWKDARSTLRKLTGRRAVELGNVMKAVDALAATGQLTPGRIPVLFEIIGRNREWWGGNGSLLSYGARAKFTGSRIVWQSYPGMGIQPQWLGTFGDANALWKSKRKSNAVALTELLDEVLRFASPRAGGIAWESFFSFSGAPPVWVSALSQGTGIQALARASQKLARPDYLEAATAALGIFKAPPPEGVALRTDGGTHYLIYSTNSKLLVLNGFLQSLIGLFDYTQITGSAEGRALFDAGDRAAQAEVGNYDTGAWSLYDGAKESDLGYHQLVRQFLTNLCDRTTTAVYCDTAAAFAEDEVTPPEMRVVTRRAVTKKPVPIRFTLSKVSTVTLYVDDARITSARLGHGTQTLTWPGSSKPGDRTVRIDATDLAGNRGSAEGVITLERAKKTR